MFDAMSNQMLCFFESNNHGTFDVIRATHVHYNSEIKKNRNLSVGSDIKQSWNPLEKDQKIQSYLFERIN